MEIVSPFRTDAYRAVYTVQFDDAVYVLHVFKPGFPGGMAIGQHGSWNRSRLSGYKLVFVPFADGRPAGPPRDILTGFLSPDEKASCGRPVGVALGPDGSLLAADDVGDLVWRVTGAG